MSAIADALRAALSDRYRIERELGSGGMATVYLAHDIKHDRKVALKVLRPELAAVIGAERFLAEIKTTANLQHPHILGLHDSGEANHTVFYVMPFVEGESLRDRLNREKQIPVTDAIRIAREVASALDYAHRHGVVHRDIKPENILLHEGQALVADFGIALAVSHSEGGSRMTETGMSLGTPHYMAPEQAMGEREITPKADIYALGCVLYEMLTGDPPFTGSTAQAIVARTLTESPRPIVKQRHTVPPHVEATVFMALEKLPADRFATAGEFAAALDNPDMARRTTASFPSATSAKMDWRTRAAIPLAALAAMSTAGLIFFATRAKPAAPLTRYALSFDSAQAPVPERPIEISPNGANLLFVGPVDVGVSLWIKPRDRASATAVPGTVNVTRAAFAPDGESLVYVQLDQQIKKVPLSGGAALTLGDSAMPARGIAWMDDHTVVYIHAPNEMRRRPDVGGAATTVWKADTATAWNPMPLPGSRGVLFSRCGPAGCTAQRDLWVADLRGGKAHFVVAGALMGRYVSTGHILYVRPDGAMLSIAFDPKSLEARGTPVPVRDSIALALNNVPTFAVSDNGTFVARTGSSLASSALYQMVWLDRAGRETPVDTSWAPVHLTGYAGNVGWSLSQDGTRLAIGLNTEAGDQIWVKQLPTGPAMRISFDSVRNYRPRWMPDGRTVMFVSTRTTTATLAKLFKRPSDGTGSDELVFGTNKSVQEGAWGSDGKTLIIRTGGSVNLAGNRDISVVQAGVDTVPKPLVATPDFDESAIALSPDGKWLAYESNESGPTNVFIRPFPNTLGGRWQVSTSGGRAPLWARNGRELFYVNESRDMVVVPVAPGTSPGLGLRKVLFHLRDDIYLSNPENYTPYDASPDGRFLMAKRLHATAAQIAPLVVTENWFQELRQRVAKR
jgi:serine/threonine-protein kinase